MNESAFSLDEQRRRQHDAEAVLRKSIGIQDAEGNQLHGRERTERARSLREEMKAAARAEPADDPKKAPPAAANDLRVAINAPHRATVRGNQVALTIVADAPAQGGAETQAEVIHFPFKVTIRVTPESDPATYDRIVEFDSKLITSLAPVTYATITGLAEENEPAEDDTGWELFIEDDEIWLEVGFTSGEPSSWAIKSLGAGDTWPNFDPGAGSAKCEVEWSGSGTGASPYLTTKSRIVIARTFTDSADAVQLVQCVHGDLILTRWDVDGKNLYVIHPRS